jgi:PAS domain S-box
MLKSFKRIMYAIIVFAFILSAFSGCKKDSKEKTDIAIDKMSFRDIPGITQAEINAIEALRRRYGSFVYGINLTTEAFRVDGSDEYDINGYAVMFCDWLSELFRIQFRPKYYQWGDLLRGLESGEVDFTGELMSTLEGKAGYLMSSPTINRTIRQYRLKNSTPIPDIHSRKPRFAFLKEAVVAGDIKANTDYDFETILADSHIEAYQFLKNGRADAFFGLETAEGAFDVFGDVISEEFFPLIFRSSCLSTHKEEFLPIINVLDKAMTDNVLIYLTEMQRKGNQQYFENRVSAMLTEEEREFIRNNADTPIPIVAEFSNYPISFYNKQYNRWEGIFFEALDQVSSLTGLKFKIDNDQNTPLLKLIDELEKGNAMILPELHKTKEYVGRFLWSSIPIINDNFAIISRGEFRNIDINDVFHLHVAIRGKTIYSEMFKTIFPAHKNFTEYETMEDTWDALRRGEVDVIFASRRRLVIYTNYYELSEFKLNLVFEHSFNSYFAYNKDAAILKSIVDKALSIININNMSNQWIYRTYDYRVKMAAAQRPWLIGASISFFLVLVLVSVMLIRSRTVGKQLEKLVAMRTGALKFETAKLQSVLSSIPDLLYTKDKNLRYTQCNNAYEQFMGVKEEDIIGKTNSDGMWFTPEDVEKIQITDEIVINENRVISHESKIRSPSTGIEGIYETVKAPLRQDGAVVGIVSIVHDVTKRREMERDLSLQTSLFKTMLTSLPDAVFCKNLNFRYTLCNNYMASIFGKQVEDILGKDDVTGLGLPPETAAVAAETDLKVMNEQQRIAYEEWVPCADGVRRLFETVKSPLILDGEVVGIMAIGRDVTKRKEMEEEATAANRAKSSFLANMSHELRTPLNVVIGLTDLTLEEDLADHVKVNLAKISNAGTTLLSIVNDILDFSKIESGKLTLSPVEYYMSSILNDIITLVLTRLGEKPITFKLNIKDDLPNQLTGDDLRVKQILTNLLTNAIKYTREGSIELIVRSMREGDRVWLDVAVSDTGMGIPKDDIGSLFMDYYQVAANSNRNIEGTGLGLPITKRLVEMMEGEISVESEYGKGSTFRFRIKQGYVNDSILGAEVSEKLRNFSFSDDKRIVSKKLVRVNLSYARVLVVDDMQTNLDVASGILRKYQMKVDVLSNGPAAIDRIKSGNPVYDLVFMDHMMPGMDGIETVDNIRAIGTEYAKKVPIIALTANAIQGTDKMFYAHDFQAFVTKPIDVMEMDTVLRKWIYDPKREGSVLPGEPAVIEEEENNIEIEIPGVDTKKGLALYAGDTDIYLPLLRSYITNTPGTLEKLKNVTAENLPSYVITVHGLKGTSAGIGAEQIRAQALELENMSRAGDLQGVWSKSDKLIADTEVIVANVKKWLEENDVQKAKERKKAPDREILAKLRESCESYDMDGIDEAMKELEKFDYEEEADLITWIREKIDISKMGEVANRLASL